MARPRRTTRVSASTRAELNAKKEPSVEAPANDDEDDKKTVASTPKSAQKRQRGASHDESEEEASLTPVTPKQKTGTSNQKDDGDDSKSAASVDAEESEEETSRPKKRGRPRKSEPKTKTRGPTENRTCPHCDKLCSTAHGLRYHVEHKVCRKEKKPHAGLGGPLASPVGTETSEDRRTCSNCRKLCASVGGLKYHIEHRVCFKASYGIEKSPEASDANKEEADKGDVAPKANKGNAKDDDDESQDDDPASKATKVKLVDDDDDEEATAPDSAKAKVKDDQVEDEDMAASDANEDIAKHDDDEQDDEEEDDDIPDTTKGRGKEDDDEEDDETLSKDATVPEPNETKFKDDDEGDDSSSEDDDDDDESFDEEEAKKDSRTARLRNRRKRPTSAKKTGRGSEKNRTCPHCAKICSTAYGLKYHIDKMVCRKEQKVGPKKPKQARKKSITPQKRGRGRASVQGSSKRFRGRKEDRTCPNCKKLFTSSLGCDYHVKHRVCVDQVENLVGSVAFPILEKGSKFVTSYGIVEVVADDRVTPTYKYPADIKAAMKSFTSYRDKQTVTRRRVQIAYGFQSRLRRRRLKRAYDFDHINPDTTRKAYFGGSALAREAIAREVSADPMTVHKQDPMCPPEAFPDRIVVCKPIPDARPTFYSLDQEEGIIRGGLPFASNLYLRRRDFHKPYSTELSIHICQDCGQDFNSREGYAYHHQSKVCFKRSKARGAQRAEMNEAAQVRLERYVKRSSTKLEKKRKAVLAVYPQVWLSLGFTVMEYKKVQGQKADEIFVEKRVQCVDETLEKLRELVKQEAMRNTNEKLGAMYPQVFKSLGFEKSRKRKKSNAEQGPKMKRSRRKRVDGDEEDEMEALRVIPPPVPPPQILDMHVLIDEAKSGRYPSIKRYTGDYADICVICKDGGKLLLCDFCKNAVHLKCLLKTIAFKELDPEEDFLCHSCARKIVSRRNRAEKRRLLKQQTVLDNARQKVADAAVDDTEQSDYHVTAAVGKELSELLELLEDSRHRLHHMVEASRLNNFRRAQLP